MENSTHSMVCTRTMSERTWIGDGREGREVESCGLERGREQRGRGVSADFGATGLEILDALVFSIIVSTIVLQPSYKFRQAFTFCTSTYFQLNLFCFPSLDSRIAFIQLPQLDSTQLGGIHCNCSRCVENRAVFTFICLVQSNTGVGHLHLYPFAIAVVDSQLIYQSSDTAFSLCV